MVAFLAAKLGEHRCVMLQLGYIHHSRYDPDTIAGSHACYCLSDEMYTVLPCKFVAIVFLKRSISSFYSIILLSCSPFRGLDCAK